MPRPLRTRSSSKIKSDLAKAAQLQDGGRVEEAEAIYRKVLTVDRHNVHALHQLALLLLNRKQTDEALTLLAAAVKARPDSADALATLGLVLNRTGNHAHAVVAYDRALAIRPDNASWWINRGISQCELLRHAEAVESCDRAIRLAPDHVAPHYNRANALRELGRIDDALAAYASALAVAPDHAGANLNEGLTRLLTGDFARGWQQYEWRWKFANGSQGNRFKELPWDGVAPIAGRTILLHAEQGLGDTMQFARYVPLVAALGASIVLEIQAPLMPLFAGFPGVTHLVAAGQPLPPHDLHCPLLSLPLAFKTDLETIPGGRPYLMAPADRTAQWSQQLPEPDGVRVALCWSGNPNHKLDRHRSIPADKLAPLLAVPGVQFVSVQKDIRAGDLAFLGHADLLDAGSHCRDFADTAAVLALSDLVITVDTSVAHLAGALGRPTWILLQHSPDFRWLLGRADSPWYPTARLYRQPAFHDWSSVIAQVSDDLTAWQDPARRSRRSREIILEAGAAQSSS